MTGKALRTLPEIIRDGMERWPGVPALTFVGIGPNGRLTEHKRSYFDLWRNGRALAAGLRRVGMVQSDAFAIVAQNHPEFVEAMVGSALAGTVFVPIDSRASGDKLHYMLDFAGCRGAIVAHYALKSVLEIRARLPGLKWIWVIEESSEVPDRGAFESVANILAAEVDDAQIRFPDLNSPMQFLYTSGTTGDPKAILSPHARFAGVATLGGALGYKSSDRPYTGLSLTHANAQLITLGNSLAMGLPLVISRSFTKSRLWEIVRRYECTTFNLLGGMATAVFAEPAREDDRNHQVRFVLSAGMPAALWKPFSERFGVEIFEFYGAAEGGLTTNAPGAGPVGSIGKPPGTLRCVILDEQDNECAVGELGEMCFQNADGSVPLVEYYRNSAATAAKAREGWFRSGDIGYKDRDGWIYFSHRAGGSLRRNGEFINPGDIEATVAAIDGVEDVHIYGVPTAGNAPGESEIVAAIVPNDAATFDSTRIFAECRRLLGPNSVPRYLQVLESIPKTASEKPQSRFLLAMLNGRDARIIGIDGSGTIQIKGSKS